MTTTETTPIPFQLTRKGKGWDCTDHGPLTVAEARDVRTTHGDCGPDCRISKVARKALARLIDAPTVRDRAFRRAK